ncbi:hypothetical protein ACFYM6_11865, partial [Micromonospora sp. NPDC006431]
PAFIRSGAPPSGTEAELYGRPAFIRSGAPPSGTEAELYGRPAFIRSGAPPSGTEAELWPPAELESPDMTNRLPASS